MLQPTALSLHVIEGHHVILATYIATEEDDYVPMGTPLYLAFYTKYDLSDMTNLFFPGDREGYVTPELALEEIKRYGFE